MRIVLIVPAHGQMNERRIPLEDGPIAIDDAGGNIVVLDDPSASAGRIRFERVGDEWTVVDHHGTGPCSVGGVRLRPGVSRIVRPPHVVRVGERALELAYDDEAFADGLETRELVLEAAARLAARAPALVPRVRVVEGRRRGETLDLVLGRQYMVGRGDAADVKLDEGDASREQLTLIWRGNDVIATDLGGAKGSHLARARLVARRGAVWDPALMLRVADTVLSLELPLSVVQMLESVIEGPRRETMSEDAASTASPAPPEDSSDEAARSAGLAALASAPVTASPARPEDSPDQAARAEPSPPSGLAAQPSASAPLASVPVTASPAQTKSKRDRWFPVIAAGAVLVMGLCVALLIWVLIA